MQYTNAEQVIQAIVHWQKHGFRQPLELKLTEELTDFQSLQRIFAALFIARAIFKKERPLFGYGTVKLDLAINETDSGNSSPIKADELGAHTFNTFSKEPSTYLPTILKKDNLSEFSLEDLLLRLCSVSSKLRLLAVLILVDLLSELKLKYIAHQENYVANIFAEELTDSEPQLLRLLDLSDSSFSSLRASIRSAFPWEGKSRFVKVILRNIGLTDADVSNWLANSLGNILQWHNTTFKVLDLRDNPLITYKGWELIAKYVCAHTRWCQPLQVLGMPEDLTLQIKNNAVMGTGPYVLRIFFNNPLFELLDPDGYTGPQHDPETYQFPKKKPLAPLPTSTVVPASESRVSNFESEGGDDPEKRPLLEPQKRNMGYGVPLN